LVDEICKKSADDLPDFLKNFCRDYISKIPEEKLFDVAFSFKVSNRLLKSLETLFDHSAPVHVILSKNDSNKPDWKILPNDYCPDFDCSIMQKEYIIFLLKP
jgi:hypothetical protein